MSRKVILRELPDLGELFPEFTSFKDSQNKRQLLEELLRRAINSLRTNARVTFYSMREVARFFKTSLKSVAVVYDHLGKEGLITIVRGSRTILEGKHRVPRSAVRGVVGIPVFLPAFVFGNNPRSFLISLEDHLRRKGYMVNFIFYSYKESEEVLLGRLLAHNLDILFWANPVATRSTRHILLSLEDAGVQLVVVGDNPDVLPGQRYLMDMNSGLREAASGWKEDGLEEVYLIGPPGNFSAHVREKSQEMFRAEGFKINHETVRPELFFRSIAHYQENKRAGLIFLSYIHYETLCNYDWKAMANLFKTRRTLLAQGPVFHVAFSGRTLLVDTLERFDHDKIARRISLDIVQQQPFDRAHLEVFRSVWRSNINLGEVCREL